MSSRQAQARHTAADAQNIFEIERELSDYLRKHDNLRKHLVNRKSVAGAAGTEDGERAKDKIAKAAAVEAGMKGDTPLPDKIGKAVETGNLTAVLKYLRKGGDVDAIWTAKFNRTMLHEATCSRNPQMVSALLQHRADPNTQSVLGTTALVMAANLGDAAIVKLLLDAGADPTIAMHDGLTAAHVAERVNQTECARLLPPPEPRSPASSGSAALPHAMDLHVSASNSSVVVPSPLSGVGTIVATEEDTEEDLKLTLFFAIIRGVSTRPELNGACGVVVGLDPTTGRRRVLLDEENPALAKIIQRGTGRGEGPTVSLSPENLEYVDQNTAAAALRAGRAAGSPSSDGGSPSKFKKEFDGNLATSAILAGEAEPSFDESAEGIISMGRYAIAKVLAGAGGAPKPAPAAAGSPPKPAPAAAGSPPKLAPAAAPPSQFRRGIALLAEVFRAVLQWWQEPLLAPIVTPPAWAWPLTPNRSFSDVR